MGGVSGGVGGEGLGGVTGFHRLRLSGIASSEIDTGLTPDLLSGYIPADLPAIGRPIRRPDLVSPPVRVGEVVAGLSRLSGPALGKLAPQVASHAYAPVSSAHHQ